MAVAREAGLYQRWVPFCKESRTVSHRSMSEQTLYVRVSAGLLGWYVSLYSTSQYVSSRRSYLHEDQKVGSGYRHVSRPEVWWPSGRVNPCKFTFRHVDVRCVVAVCGVWQGHSDAWHGL